MTLRRSSLLLCTAVIVSGCPTISPTFVRCANDSFCPSGYVCGAAGFCASFASDGGLDSGTHQDAGAADGGLSPDDAGSSDAGPGVGGDAGGEAGDAGSKATPDAGMAEVTIVFFQPVITAGTNPPVADVSGSSPVTVHVTALAQLSSVVIASQGGSVVASWDGPTGSVFESTVDWALTVGTGQHLLTATANCENGASAQATLAVDVAAVDAGQGTADAGFSDAGPISTDGGSPDAGSAADAGVGAMDGGLQAPSIIFTQPALTAGTLPAVADVSGTSPVAVQVTSRVQLSSLIITYDTGLPLVSFPSPSGTSFSSGITWANTPGVGSHVLTATLTCNDGETAKATETVVVAQPACTTDANCATGDRCCTTSGLCYPIVAPGADCDCEHPCPTDQGCFPGVCGAAPQKCRPGCFPGSWGPAPNYGEPAATCANDPITNQPAYCAQLPASQSTAANQGGACAVGDACDPITQTGCAGIPLNRALPVSATNPVVPYNCVPVAPSVNGCIPAGPLGSGATNCNGDTEPGITGTACGATAGNCAAGLDCTQVVDSNGDALTPELLT